MTPDTVISYKLLPPVGAGKTKTEGTLVEFFLEDDCFLFFNYIPPYHVVIDYLMSGRADNGMSGGVEWKPFVIEKDCYKEVKKRFIEIKGDKIIQKECPEWITRYREWTSWVLCDFKGEDYFSEYPSTILSELFDKMSAQASMKGDSQLANFFLVQRITTVKEFEKDYSEYLKTLKK